MAGFNSNRGVPKNKSKGSSSSKIRSKNVQQNKSFKVDEKEVRNTSSTKDEEVISKNDLNKMVEKVDIPTYIPSVKNCDEALFLHIINHSRTKDIGAFMMGSVDYSSSNLIDKCIRESKKEFVPSDSVDLSDGNRINNLKR